MWCVFFFVEGGGGDYVIVIFFFQIMYIVIIIGIFLTYLCIMSVLLVSCPCYTFCGVARNIGCMVLRGCAFRKYCCEIIFIRVADFSVFHCMWSHCGFRFINLVVFLMAVCGVSFDVLLACWLLTEISIHSIFTVCDVALSCIKWFFFISQLIKEG